jgi:hypothetical protein
VVDPIAGYGRQRNVDGLGSQLPRVRRVVVDLIAGYRRQRYVDGLDSGLPRVRRGRGRPDSGLSQVKERRRPR